MPPYPHPHRIASGCIHIVKSTFFPYFLTTSLFTSGGLWGLLEAPSNSSLKTHTVLPTHCSLWLGWPSAVLAYIYTYALFLSCQGAVGLLSLIHHSPGQYNFMPTNYDFSQAAAMDMSSCSFHQPEVLKLLVPCKFCLGHHSLLEKDTIPIPSPVGP